MSVDKLETEWAADSVLDPNDLQAEIIKTAKLHSKWYSYLNASRRELMRVNVELQRMEIVIEGFYSRTLTLAEMQKYGFEEMPEKRLLKGELEKAIDNHPKIIELKVRKGLAIDAIKFLEDIVKAVHNRGFLIRDMIEWKKFTAGG